jgi:hypothetical protein
MPLYLFFWNMLAWSITIAVLCPLTIPWAWLSYKIWHGNKPIEEEMDEELWTRSFWASFYMALASVVWLFLDYEAVEWTEFPSGPVHTVFYLSFLALAAYIMLHSFSLEDFFQGLNLAVIYLYIPTGVFFVLWLLIRGFLTYGLFSYVLSWLKDPAA